MGRTMILAGMIALLIAPAVDAAEYVPGKTRDDGLYVPPHFRVAAGSLHAAEVWFDALRRDQALLDERDKAPPPASAGAPPAPANPPAYRF